MRRTIFSGEYDLWASAEEFVEKHLNDNLGYITVSDKRMDGFKFTRTETTVDSPKSHVWTCKEEGADVTLCDEVMDALLPKATTIWVRFT